MYLCALKYFAQNLIYFILIYLYHICYHQSTLLMMTV
jgi:hypothetical protein